MFFQRMDETIDAKTPYNVHLETYKCLDMLIKMLENLYPNSAQLAKAKEQEKTDNHLKNMQGIKRDILMKLFTNEKEMTPQELKEWMNNEIDKASAKYHKEENAS